MLAGMQPLQTAKKKISEISSQTQASFFWPMLIGIRCGFSMKNILCKLIINNSCGLENSVLISSHWIFPYIPLLHKSTTVSVWSKTAIEHVDFLIRISEKARKGSKFL